MAYVLPRMRLLSVGTAENGEGCEGHQLLTAFLSCCHDLVTLAGSNSIGVRVLGGSISVLKSNTVYVRAYLGENSRERLEAGFISQSRLPIGADHFSAVRFFCTF